MSDELSTAGKLLSGKEGDRSPQELAARKVRLSRQNELKVGATTGSDSAVATKCEDKEHDEFYTDVLARFGIQI